jgi:hypothetical protein
MARSWEERPDLQTFDPTRVGDPHELTGARGVCLVTLADDVARDPDALERVYHLVRKVEADVPRVTPVSKFDFEQWRRQSITRPGLISQAYFLAVCSDEYVGVSFLRRPAGLPAVTNQGCTGVARSARGRGIALGLKVATATFAKADGARVLRTWNSDRNHAILRVNDALGFVRDVTVFDLVKQLKPGRAT